MQGLPLKGSLHSCPTRGRTPSRFGSANPRRKPTSRKGGVSRKRLQVESSAGPRAPYRAVEGAVRQLNQWLSLRERLRHRTDVTDEPGDSDRNVKRRITMRVQKRASVKLREAVEAEKSLRTYLVLPPEQYSVLDPKWIERCPEKGPAAFIITVPLEDLLGVDMTPKVSVRVHVNEAQEKVTFLVDSFSLGKPHMDKFFKIRIRSTLYASSHRDRLGPFKRFNGRFSFDATNETEELESVIDDVQDLENLRKAGVPIEVNASSEPGANHSFPGRPALPCGENGDFEDDIEMDYQLHAKRGADAPDTSKVQSSTSESSSSRDRITTLLPELDGDSVRLHCFVQLHLVTIIPPALLFIPNLVLGSVGRIILRAVLNALIPNFLDLVTNDYKRWVTGDRKPSERVGSLVSDSLK
ncbi:hypothetical protein BSKO_04602 [Bryopsis sp. KO-2023]|nr:hypothetical protein BSKO_04602 [Bryopsis sp. KO-2023]